MAAEKFSHQFYDPVADYMEAFFGQQQISFLGYVSSFLSAILKGCMPVLITEFLKYTGIRSSTQMLSWYHWNAEFT